MNGDGIINFELDLGNPVFAGLAVGSNARLAFWSDLNNDGNKELVAGNTGGTIKLFVCA